jgi:L-methionine (R)-S-oxide reductase
LLGTIFTMTEDLIKVVGTKEEIYQGLLPQIKALVGEETDTIANLANTCAALKEAFDFFWVGFYLVKNDELVLAPFQGPIACTRIQKGKGVCGKSWELGETISVEDVEKFEGHIACSALSKSEIVIPILQQGIVIGVLDIDSTTLSAFDSIDSIYLNELCIWLSERI